MEQTKPLEIAIQATGVLPRKLALDAAAVLGGSERVEVVPSQKGLVLRAVWDADADWALDRIRELGLELVVTAPRILYRKEGQWLEPRMLVVAVTPEDFMGDVMGGLNQRRGLIQGMENGEGAKRITAIVPLADLIGYGNDLDAITHGRGTASVDFFDYHPVPPGHGPNNEPSSSALRA